MISSAPFLAVFVIYLAGFVLFLAQFELRRDPFGDLAQRMLMTGLCLHAALLVGLGFRSHGMALALLSEYGVPFLILVCAYSVERAGRARYLMLFSLPIALLILLLAILHSRVEGLTPEAAPRGWLWLHLSFIFLGLAGLATAVSSAAMYLLQSAQLKSKHPGEAFLKLPSLDRLDRIHFRALVAGVLLFSFGILSGLFSARGLVELKQVLRDPKVILSFVTCLFYWVVLSLRLSTMRRGQKIAIGTLLTFALLIGTLVSSYIAPSAFHRSF